MDPFASPSVSPTVNALTKRKRVMYVVKWAELVALVRQR